MLAPTCPSICENEHRLLILIIGFVILILPTSFKFPVECSWYVQGMFQ